MEKLRKLKLHESIQEGGHYITRVPGGLLYQRYLTTDSAICFVQFFDFEVADIYQ